MEARPISNFIYVGTAIRYLIDARQGMDIHGDSAILWNIDALRTWLTENSLHVSYRAMWDLFHEVTTELESEGESVRLSASQAAEIAKAALGLRTTIYAEAGGIFAFLVTDKRYPTAKLLGGMPELLSPGVWDWLPPVAKRDFEAAGRCIAFQLPTSAAFHLMRGAEDTLRQFYCSIVRQRRISPLMWGPMVKALRERRTPPPAVLLNNLDNLRVGFRNPTQHPEKIYDEQEVQDLLSLSIDVTNRMHRHLVEQGKVANS